MKVFVNKAQSVLSKPVLRELNCTIVGAYRLDMIQSQEGFRGTGQRQLLPKKVRIFALPYPADKRLGETGSAACIFVNAIKRSH